MLRMRFRTRRERRGGGRSFSGERREGGRNFSGEYVKVVVVMVVASAANVVKAVVRVVMTFLPVAAAGGDA